MVRPALVGLIMLASSAANAELCKYIDGNGDVRYASGPGEKSWRLVGCFGGDDQPAPKPSARPAIVGASAPSILPQCLDGGQVIIGVGPSARARECTRQYCARPEYQAKVSAYGMNRRQSEVDQTDALTCITRAEQDRVQK